MGLTSGKKANIAAAILGIILIFTSAIIYTQVYLDVPEKSEDVTFGLESDVSIDKGLNIGLYEFMKTNMYDSYSPGAQPKSVAWYCNENVMPTIAQINKSMSSFLQHYVDERLKQLQIQDPSITAYTIPQISLDDILSIDNNSIQVNVSHLLINVTSGSSIRTINISKQEFMAYRYWFIYATMGEWFDAEDNPLQNIFGQLFDVKNRPCQAYACSCRYNAGSTPPLISEGYLQNYLYLKESNIDYATQNLTKTLQQKFNNTGITCSVQLADSNITNTYNRTNKANANCDTDMIYTINEWNMTEDKVQFNALDLLKQNVSVTCVEPDPAPNPAIDKTNITRSNESIFNFTYDNITYIPLDNDKSDYGLIDAVTEFVSVNTAMNAVLNIECVDETVSIDSNTGLEPFIFGINISLDVARNCQNPEKLTPFSLSCTRRGGGSSCPDLLTCFDEGFNLTHLTNLTTQFRYNPDAWNQKDVLFVDLPNGTRIGFSETFVPPQWAYVFKEDAYLDTYFYNKEFEARTLYNRQEIDAYFLRIEKDKDGFEYVNISYFKTDPILGSQLLPEYYVYKKKYDLLQELYTDPHFKLHSKFILIGGQYPDIYKVEDNIYMRALNVSLPQCEEYCLSYFDFNNSYGGGGPGDGGGGGGGGPGGGGGDGGGRGVGVGVITGPKTGDQIGHDELCANVTNICAEIGKPEYLNLGFITANKSCLSITCDEATKTYKCEHSTEKYIHEDYAMVKAYCIGGTEPYNAEKNRSVYCMEVRCDKQECRVITDHVNKKVIFAGTASNPNDQENNKYHLKYCGPCMKAVCAPNGGITCVPDSNIDWTTQLHNAWQQADSSAPSYASLLKNTCSNEQKDFKASTYLQDGSHLACHKLTCQNGKMTCAFNNQNSMTIASQQGNTATDTEIINAINSNPTPNSKLYDFKPVQKKCAENNMCADLDSFKCSNGIASCPSFYTNRELTEAIYNKNRQALNDLQTNGYKNLWKETCQFNSDGLFDGTVFAGCKKIYCSNAQNPQVVCQNSANTQPFLSNNQAQKTEILAQVCPANAQEVCLQTNQYASWICTNGELKCNVNSGSACTPSEKTSADTSCNSCSAQGICEANTQKNGQTCDPGTNCKQCSDGTCVNRAAGYVCANGEVGQNCKTGCDGAGKCNQLLSNEIISQTTCYATKCVLNQPDGPYNSKQKIPLFNSNTQKCCSNSITPETIVDKTKECCGMFDNTKTISVCNACCSTAGFTEHCSDSTDCPGGGSEAP